MIEIENELKELKEQRLYRMPKECEEGLINFSSNNYLGMAKDKRLIEAAQGAAQRYGVGGCASRFLGGNNALYKKLEEKLAKFKGAEDAIVFATGYMANVGTLTSLAAKDDIVISDKLNHASIIDGCRLSGAELRIYPHKDTSRLEKLLEASDKFNRRLVVTDGVFSMDGDIAPLPEIVRLCKKYDAFLMVDDAHGGFVLGKNGKGTAEYFGLNGGIDIHMGTLSKAAGSLGGFICGAHSIIDYIRNKSRSLIYSTALPPTALAASICAIDVIEKEPSLRKKVLDNAEYLRNKIKSLGFDTLESQTQIIPILIGKTEDALQFSESLRKKGVFAPAVRPPTVPNGKCRIRLSVTAAHTKEELDRLLASLRGA